MKDRLEEIDCVVGNAPRCPDYWPMDELEWLISEVRRLRWFEAYVDAGVVDSCQFCGASTDYSGDEAVPPRHSIKCEYIAHRVAP